MGTNSTILENGKHALDLYSKKTLGKMYHLTRQSLHDISWGKKKEIPFNIFLSSRVFGTPVLWSPHVKSWLIGKDSDAGRDWEQEEKGTAEDEMAGWHHWLNGCKSEWIPGVGDGQGGLACCDSWSRKESATTEQLNWTELAFYFHLLETAS